jgi:hypothetical protein
MRDVNGNTGNSNRRNNNTNDDDDDKKVLETQWAHSTITT